MNQKLTLWIFAMMLLSSLAAAQMEVIKTAEIRSDGMVVVKLKLRNPYLIDIPVMITDKNLLGTNGLFIKCLEQSAPTQEESGVEFPPITPHKRGTFTLGPANVTYDDPSYGRQTIYSNSVNITIEKSFPNKGNFITSIYRCDGLNIEQTTSSSGFIEDMIEPPEALTEGSLNKSREGDTSSLKKFLEKQLVFEKEADRIFRALMARNEIIGLRHLNMSAKGYQIAAVSAIATKEDSGLFELSYARPDGQTGSIKGSMEAFNVTNISSIDGDEKINIMRALENNSQFRESEQKLVSQGFSRSNPMFAQLTDNQTQVLVPFRHADGSNAKISGLVNNQSAQDILMEGAKTNYWPFITLIAGAGLGILGYRYLSNKKKEVPKPEPKDLTAQARGQILEAQNLYDEGKHKDAFELVSRAVRQYQAAMLGVEREVTTYELLSIVKENKAKIRECLEMCTIVEFAKGASGREHFDSTVALAQKLVEP